MSDVTKPSPELQGDAAANEGLAGLKPCPFCAGPGSPEPPSIGRYNWSVVCDHCGCEGPPRGDEVAFDRGDNDAEAIDAWNTRAADAELDRLRAENERLRSALDLTAGDAHMLERAIREGDPKSELLVRIGDIKQTCRAALGEQP